VRSRKPRGRQTSRRSEPVRGSLSVLVLASVPVEVLATWLRSGRLGGHVVVRCRDGHLFTTLWIPAASVKSVRLGPWRLQRCPVGHHWTVVSPVNEANLTEEERRTAAEHRDIRLP
jgi:hypothetical protein